MGSKICMNEVCRSTTSFEWKKGWVLKSGGFATLCSSCGSAYERLVFCETFHLEESGWRECKHCAKRIHCGCIASKSLHEYMDFGGIGCIRCVKLSEAHTSRPVQIHGEDVSNGIPATNGISNMQPLASDGLMQLSKVIESSEPSEYVSNGISARNGISNMEPLACNGLMQLSKVIESSEPSDLFQSQNDDTDLSLGQLNREKSVLPIGESTGPSLLKKLDKSRLKQGVKDMYESSAQPSLNFSLSMPLVTSSSAQPIGGESEGKEPSKESDIQQRQQSRQVSPKAPKPAHSTSPEANKGTLSQQRVARPPVEGRGRSQLLPRYWPRISDQELQKICEDLKATVIPLFEKVLSASDAGRIGRLVLPKACAELYFPLINQSEGLPVRVKDTTGKEWTFQFRFWPNNNSRMYVLEGVTPCIQNMQLEAGDTVIFSRIDPGGMLVIGCRKATNNDTQDIQTNAVANGGSPKEANENLAANGGRSGDDNVQRHVVSTEKKRTRNIGSKNKRLHIHSEDAVELRVTWEEAQDLMRVPPAANPTVVLIEDQEIEEYDEPPIFGKKTIFTVRDSGERDQWTECDSCSKWRRLPFDVLVPAKWSCVDNVWNPTRCSCSVPEDINQRDLDALLRVNKEFKRRRVMETKVAEDCEPSGLDALATAAVLGDNLGELGDTSVGATTKHPRHRPGCSCIVCIQPPSGKGKHDPSCKCNVCLTVRRRFKTLMMRKKKRQSDREAELAQEKDQDQDPSKNGSELDMEAGEALLQIIKSENEGIENENLMEVAEAENGILDLNSHPNRDDELLAVAAGMSMTNLVNATNLPLEMFLKQTGFGSLGPCSSSQAAGDGEGHIPDEGCNTSADVEMVNKAPDESRNTSADVEMVNKAPDEGRNTSADVEMVNKAPDEGRNTSADVEMEHKAPDEGCNTSGDVEVEHKAPDGGCNKSADVEMENKAEEGVNEE